MSRSPTVFEQQREELVREIAVVRLYYNCVYAMGVWMYLANDYDNNDKRAWNKSYRTSTVLIGIWRVSLLYVLHYPLSIMHIQIWESSQLIEKVGNEFGSVEALWSQFEHFMGREGQGQGQGQGQAQGTGQGTSPETQGQGHGQSHEGRKEGQSEMQDVEEEELWVSVDMCWYALRAMLIDLLIPHFFISFLSLHKTTYIT